MHKHGAFADPPVHHDCGFYALQVCPFLAVRYTGRIDDATLQDENVPDDVAIARLDYMQPGQPERFGFGAAEHYEVLSRSPGEQLFIVAHWRYVEFWSHGQPVNAPDGLAANQPIRRHG
jgi:hypothetical protein